MSKAFLYLRKSYSLISRLSSLLPWIILRSSVMNALRYSSNSLKSSSSSSNGHRELSTGLFKSEQFNQEGLTPGSRAQRSIYCSPGRAIWRDHSERMDEAAVRLHQHFRRDLTLPTSKRRHYIRRRTPHIKTAPSIKIGDALPREGTPLQNFGQRKASVFCCEESIALFWHPRRCGNARHRFIVNQRPPETTH